MTIRDHIREWLGINEALRAQRHERELLLAFSERLGTVQTQLQAIGPGLGRVIAKLDAKFVESEHSDERRAESDRIGEEVLKRLNAEAAARAPYND